MHLDLGGSSARPLPWPAPQPGQQLARPAVPVHATHANLRGSCTHPLPRLRRQLNPANSSAGWLAGADAADPAHVRVCAARDGALEAGQTLVTTDFVVDETLTLIRFRLGLPAADEWWEQIDGSARLRWERIDSDRIIAELLDTIEEPSSGLA